MIKSLEQRQKPRAIAMTIFLVGLFLFASGQTSAAATLADSGTRVYDYAGLLSQREIAELETRIDSACQRIGMDIILLTSADTEGKDSQTYADDFYDYNGFGVGDFRTGILYFIDMEHRVPTISTTGDMIDYINDARLERIFDALDPSLQQSDWFGSAAAFIDEVTYWVAAGLPKAGNRYDSQTGQTVDEYGNLLTQPRRLSRGEILIALAIGTLAGLFRYVRVNRKYRMKASPYAFNLKTNAVLNFVDQKDEFVRSTTSRVRIHDNGHIGSRGSRVHIGGSGTRHGGGSGRGF